MEEQTPARALGIRTNENPASADWAAARGERWRAQITGLEATLMPIDPPLIAALKLDAPYRIADIGCGGGGTSLEILRAAPAGSVVNGFDIAPGLIELARTRIPPDERAIAFEVADMATAQPAQLYDRLVSRFGIMFFEDPQAAFTNLGRWLAPGGRFAFAAWGRPADNTWSELVRDVVAQLIALPPADPEAPGRFRYADADKLLALLVRAGFEQLEVRDWRGALPIGGELSPAEAADFALASFAPFGELLGQAGDAALKEARQLLTTRFSQHHQAGAVRMDACVHFFTGARA
jgi:SAM-dependent methyltransferase